MPRPSAPKGGPSPIPFIDEDFNLHRVTVESTAQPLHSAISHEPHTKSPYPAAILGSPHHIESDPTNTNLSSPVHGPSNGQHLNGSSGSKKNGDCSKEDATPKPKTPLQRQPTDETDAEYVRESPVEMYRNGASTGAKRSPEHPRKKFFRKLRLFRMPVRRIDSSTSDEEARTPLRKASIRFTRSLLSGKSSNESNLTQRTRLPTSDSEWEEDRKKSLQRGPPATTTDTPVAAISDLTNTPPLPSLIPTSFQPSDKQLRRESKETQRRGSKDQQVKRPSNEQNRKDTSSQQQSPTNKKAVSKKQIEEFLDELSSGSYHSNERPSQVHYNNKATGRTYRSQSVFSADPASPYYVSKGNAAENNENVRRSPSVSCVLEVLRREQREAELKGIVIPPGISLAAFDKPKVSTIRQHYYPEGGWGWVICSIAIFVHFLVHGIHWCFPLLILRIRNQFKYTVDIFPAGSFLFV